MLLVMPANAETYTAAGLRFVASGSAFSSIGGYSTSSMTFAGTGGMMLYQAFSNLDGQIESVRASSVTSTSLQDALNSVFYDYFRPSGTFTAAFKSQLDEELEKYFGATGTIGNIYKKMADLITYNSRTSDRLMYNNTSAAGWLYALNQSMATANGNLTTINGSIGVTNDRIGSSASFYSSTYGDASSKSDLLSALSASNYLFRDVLTMSGGTRFLSSLGTESTIAGRFSVAGLVTTGFVGLSRNLAGADKSTTFALWRHPEGGQESEDNLEEVKVDNILDALGLIGSELQQSVAKMQYVLADDDDIKLKDDTKPNQDAFDNNFTGSGPGAVDPGQIGDLGDISGNIKDVFGNDGGNAGDAFAVLGDGGTWSFFSEEVLNELEGGASGIAAQSDDDWMDAYDIDEDGNVTLADRSEFDLSSYLGGLLG